MKSNANKINESTITLGESSLDRSNGKLPRFSARKRNYKRIKPNNRISITVEEGIEIPKRYGRESELTKVLRALKVGQSFVVDDFRIRAIVTTAAIRYGVKITTRKVDEGYRIWRIA